MVLKAGRRRAKQRLSPRFDDAIDRAAMRVGKGGSDAYFDDWRRESREVEAADLEEFLNVEAQRIESAYSDEQLEMLVKGKGHQLSDNPIH